MNIYRIKTFFNFLPRSHRKTIKIHGYAHFFLKSRIAKVPKQNPTKGKPKPKKKKLRRESGVADGHESVRPVSRPGSRRVVVREISDSRSPAAPLATRARRTRRLAALLAPPRENRLRWPTAAAAPAFYAALFPDDFRRPRGSFSDGEGGGGGRRPRRRRGKFDHGGRVAEKSASIGRPRRRRRESCGEKKFSPSSHRGGLRASILR